MSLWSRLALWGLLGVAVVTAVTLSWHHYTALVDSNVKLTSTVTELTQSVAAEKSRSEALAKAIASWDKAAESQAKALRQLSDVQQEATKQTRTLLNVLSTHNLGNLAAKKPGLIEKRVNAGSADTVRMFEQASSPNRSGINAEPNVPKANGSAGSKSSKP